MAATPAQYQNLGQFSFLTGPDLTGLNPGNMTSTLDTTTIKASKFELYRLVVGVNNIPSATPMVMQTAAGTGTGTLLTMNFPSSIATGNMLVVAAATSTGTITGCTIGTSADNFAAVPSTATVTSSVNGTTAVSMWADPDIGETGTQVIATLGASSSAVGYAYEITGVVTSAAVGTVTDFSARAATSGAVITTPAGVTSASEDIAIGLAAAIPVDFGLTGDTTTSQPALWTQQSPLEAGNVAALSGYTLIPGAGATGAYSTEMNGGDSSSAAATCIAAFLSEAGETTSLPFTVMVDNQTWDVATTVPGVGYTYDPQNPMYINVGQRLAVLWTTLPSSLYANYARNFVVTAFFRFDPGLPGNLQDTQWA